MQAPLLGIRLRKLTAVSGLEEVKRRLRACLLNPGSRGGGLRSLPACPRFGDTKQSGDTSHLRSGGWSGSGSEGAGTPTRVDFAGHWTSQAEWNRSRETNPNMSMTRVPTS